MAKHIWQYKVTLTLDVPIPKPHYWDQNSVDGLAHVIQTLEDQLPCKVNDVKPIDGFKELTSTKNTHKQ